MKDCPYCRGTGTQYVESGSSLSYTCPDCGGSGCVPECPVCGREYYGDFCEDCYGVCSCCGDVETLEHLDDEDICEVCSEDADEARHYLALNGWYTGNLSRLQLGVLAQQANNALRDWIRSFPAGTGHDVNDHIKYWTDKLVSMLDVPEYECPGLSKLVCGFCGHTGISVSFLGCESDSDGEFENWNAECTHCGKRSVDMDDPNSAVDIITNGDKGEVVDVG